MNHDLIGTVAVGETAVFRLEIERRCAVKNVVLNLTTDGAADTLRVPLTWADTQLGIDTYCVSLEKLAHGLYFYTFECDGTVYGRSLDFQTVADGEPFQLTVYEQVHRAPNFLRGGVMYQIMTDRFCSAAPVVTKDGVVMRADWGGVPRYLPNEHGIVPNNDFFGGNIRGILEKLPYLQSLHVTCIYLNPIFLANSNHKYDTADYFQIDPMFGTEEELVELIDRAKACGMSVILDGVFSHTGDDSVYFNRYGKFPSVGAFESKDSPYASWYKFREFPNDYECWWGVKILPNVNEEDPSYREFIAGKRGVVRYWLEKGVAGWRLDVADELPDAFIEDVTACAKSARNDALVLGEVWEDASNKISYSQRRKYFLGRELDSVTNYVFRTGILDFITSGDSAPLSRAVKTVIYHYPKHVVDCLMNVVGTHDTPRMLTSLSGLNAAYLTKQERSVAKLTPSQYEVAAKRLKQAAVLQYTLPGFPCVFYGDEAGMEGHEDPFNRRCYPWGHEDTDILSFYTKLGEIRHRASELTSGTFTQLLSKNGLFVFERADGAHKLVVAVNAGFEDATLPKEGEFIDMETDMPLTAFTVKAGGYRILRACI